MSPSAVRNRSELEPTLGRVEGEETASATGLVLRLEAARPLIAQTVPKP